MSFSHADRAARLASIDSDPFDLVVIGGGITGAGIAHEAAARGLRTVLVEQGDIASGTSSASSKLVHGGLRYLEQLQFGLVSEAVRERALLLRLAPDLVRPIDFLLPTYKESPHSAWKLRLGMWIYQRLAGSHRLGKPRHISAAELALLEPALRQEELVDATLYQDCQTNDARLTLAVARAAHQSGAAVLSYCEVTGAARESGRIARIQFRDRLTGAAQELAGRVFVVAGGPWTDLLLARLGAEHPPLVRPTQGVHIALPFERAPIGRAAAVTHPADRRAMFLLPWGSHTIVGTTDTDHTGSPDGLCASAADVDYLLAAANHYLPGRSLTPADVTSTWAGLRPLVNEPGKPPSKVSREHVIETVEPGLVAVVGGKLTTFRVMARQTVEQAGGRELSLAERLPPEPYPVLPEPAGLEGLEQAVGEELCMTATDYLRRRTLLFYKARDQGLEHLDEVVARMAALVGWDRARCEAERAAYREEVAASRAFRGIQTAGA